MLDSAKSSPLDYTQQEMISLNIDYYDTIHIW